MSAGIWVALFLMLVLFLADVPIAFALLASTLSYFVVSSDLPFIAVVQRLVGDWSRFRSCASHFSSWRVCS